MIKNECEIVRDLMPNYIENQINNGSKEFVEEHIRKCNSCKEILDYISREQVSIAEEKEVEILKKYNRKMTILKLVAGILVVIILAIWGMIIANHIKEKKAYEKCEYIYDIMSKTYNNIEKIENSNNYKRTEEFDITNFDGNKCRTKRINYYKNGNYKEEYIGGSLEKWVNYGVIRANRRIFVQYDTETAIYNLVSTIASRKEINEFDYAYRREISEYRDYDIRVEEYEENEYYVISHSYKGSTIDIWINKNDMILFKIVGSSEHIYSWETDIVTDSDVELKDEASRKRIQYYIDTGKFLTE